MRGILRTERELEVTRGKLRFLEECYNARPRGDLHEWIAEEISQRSLKGTINQLREEVIWCEAHLTPSETARESAITRLRGIGMWKGLSAVIPELDNCGNLPPGIHRASLEEVEERFGRSTEVRRAEMQSLRWLVDLARIAGVERMLVNGSFVTDAFEPLDVDCALLMGQGFPRDRRAFRELRKGLPFIHMQLVRQKSFDQFANQIFATDRRANEKGVIEVLL